LALVFEMWWKVWKHGWQLGLKMKTQQKTQKAPKYIEIQVHCNDSTSFLSSTLQTQRFSRRAAEG
jgi:hypothetical protein